MIFLTRDIGHSNSVYGFEPELRPIPTFESRENGFTCKKLNCRIAWADCMNNYVHETARENKESSCFKCPIGQKVREAYADDKLTKCFHRKKNVMSAKYSEPTKKAIWPSQFQIRAS